MAKAKTYCMAFSRWPAVRTLQKTQKTDSRNVRLWRRRERLRKASSWAANPKRKALHQPLRVGGICAPRKTKNGEDVRCLQ